MATSGRWSSAFLRGASLAGIAFLPFALLLSVAPPVAAIDGVLEINQASALAGGITACDVPGFPVSICTPGAYRLTSNLSSTNGGISIESDDVSLDLNGMTISGMATCASGPQGWVVSCSAPSTGGVGIFIGSVARTTIRNGTVTGSEMGCIFGVSAAETRIRDVAVSGCAWNGIQLGTRAQLSRVRANGNGIAGIAGFGDLVAIADVIATRNGGDGVNFGGRIAVSMRDVVANANGNVGIYLGFGQSLRGFDVSRNGAGGVVLMDGSLAESGAIRDNGVVDPTACGIRGQGGAGYGGVVVTGVHGGNTATACGLVNLGNNICLGLACPP